MNTFNPRLPNDTAARPVRETATSDATPPDRRQGSGSGKWRTSAASGPDPSLALAYANPNDLTINPRNARSHSPRQIKQLAEIIRQIGFITPIIVDETNMILAGHGRHRAALKLGLQSIPTVKASDLDPAQKRAYVLADNRMAEKAGWDREALAVELGELAVLLPPLDLDLALTGFDIPEIDSILSDRPQTKPDPQDIIPSVPKRPVTRRGDCWRLGTHRILCGDARSGSDLDLLMAGERARMMASDPPYNVKISGHVQGRGRVQHAEFAFASGEMSDAAFAAFLDAAISNAIRVSKPGALHYVFMDWRHVDQLVTVCRPRYAKMVNICVWAKTNAGQGSFYRSQHEFICVFAVGGDDYQNNVELGRHGRNRSNLWTYPGVNSFGAGRDQALSFHPTVKPVALIADAIRDCTQPGDIVLDHFAGSGTMILAADKTGRRGFGIEYEPGYVDVAIERWQAATKLDAILEGDGRGFYEIAEERLNEVVSSPRHIDEAPACSGEAA